VRRDFVVVEKRRLSGRFFGCLTVILVTVGCAASESADPTSVARGDFDATLGATVDLRGGDWQQGFERFVSPICILRGYRSIHLSAGLARDLDAYDGRVEVGIVAYASGARFLATYERASLDGEAHVSVAAYAGTDAQGRRVAAMWSRASCSAASHIFFRSASSCHRSC